PGEVPGTGALEDRLDLGDVRGRRAAVAVEGGEALAILGTGVLERVDHRQRLLPAGDVARLLAGCLLGAPDPEEVVVELEGEPERPPEAAIAGDHLVVVGREQRAGLDPRG